MFQKVIKFLHTYIKFNINFQKIYNNIFTKLKTFIDLFSKSIALSGSVFCNWAFSKNTIKNMEKLSNSFAKCKFKRCSLDERLKGFLSEDIESLTRKSYDLMDVS